MEEWMNNFAISPFPVWTGLKAHVVIMIKLKISLGNTDFMSKL